MSQSTISRAITPELARVMYPFTPIAKELPSDEQLIVDGTLVRCCSLVIDDTNIFNAQLKEWQDYYNYHRSHSGLDGQTAYETQLDR